MRHLKMPSGCLRDPRASRALFLLCWISYAVTYLGRLNYAACLVEIVTAEGWSKGQAGLIATGFFLCYGLGQIINGYMGDRLSPKVMVASGLGLSGLVNLLFPLMPSASASAVLWCVNGFVQSMIWSPIVRQLSSWLPAEKRQQACVHMNSTVPVGTLAVYGLSAALVFWSSWRTVFFLSGSLLLIMSCLWFAGITALERKLEPGTIPAPAAGELHTQERSVTLWRLALMSALPLCLVGLFMQGMLKDGVTTWIPTFLEENFGFTAAASILCTTLVPIINLGGVYFSSWVNRRFFKNEILTGSLFFLGGFCSLSLLAFFPIRSALLSLLLLAVTTTLMMGINTLLASMMPHYYVPFGVCSTITGILNAGAYLGSAVSSYGNGAIVDRFGWNSILICWWACAALGALTLVLASRKWKQFRVLSTGGEL